MAGKRRRLLRNDEGKLIVRLIAYDSPKTKSPLGLVIPKGDVRSLPKTATSALVSFYDADSRQSLISLASKLPAGKDRNLALKRGQRVLHRSVVEKMVFG